MDWNRIEGNWKQFKGKVKEQWGHLTDDDLDKIAGKRECTRSIHLLGCVKTRSLLVQPIVDTALSNKGFAAAVAPIAFR
jgi:CsbD-like